MNWNPQSRRHFLQGAGSFGLVLPFLSSLAPKGYAQGSTRQKNLICFFKPNGCYPEDYFPHNLYDQSKAIMGTRNLNNNVKEAPLNNISGSISKLFAQDFNGLKSEMNLYLGLSAYQSNHNESTPFATAASFPSIDQIVVQSKGYNKSGKGVLALQGTTAGYEKPTSYAIVNSRVVPVAPVKDALVMYQRLFADLNRSNQMPRTVVAQEPNVDPNFRRLVASKKAVDMVRDDYQRLMNNTRISQNDKMIVSNYVAMVAEKQDEIARHLAETDRGVTNPTDTSGIPGIPNESVNQSPISMTDTMIDLMVAAIQANVCHTFNFQLSTSVDETVFPLLEAGYQQAAYHGVISHSLERRADQAIVDRYLFGKVAKAYQMLKNLRDSETGNPLADDTCIFVSGDIGAGDVPSNHSSHNLIALTLSGRNIGIKNGRALAYSANPKSEGYPHNQLLIGIMEAVGATDWREVLRKNSLLGSAGFGVYGGMQRSLNDAAKDQPLPYLFQS